MSIQEKIAVAGPYAEIFVMICSLEGIAIYLNSQEICVRVSNGVGYLVRVGKKFCHTIKDRENISLIIHSHFSENDVSLYGFPDWDSRTIFLLLIRVSGIGPKIALSVIDSSGPPQIVEAIFAKNYLFFSSFSGIGEKTSKKIIFELESKISSLELTCSDSSQKIATGTTSEKLNQRKDLISALVNLGYGQKEAYVAIGKTYATEHSFDQNFKIALKSLKNKGS